MNRELAVLTAAVAAHALAGVTHGSAHVVSAVSLAAWQVAFVAVVLFGAPIAGLAVVASGRHTAGGSVVTLAGVASLAFEAVFHFIRSNPDNVHAVERGAVLFGATAGLSVATTLGLLATGVWLLWRSGRERKLPSLPGSAP